MPRVRLLLSTGAAAVTAGLIVAACQSGPPKPTAAPAPTSHQDLVKRGRYLAQIGVCQACHTPPRVPDKPPGPGDTDQIDKERNFRTDPDWVRYLDTTRPYAGGVPFIIRLSKDSSATVYTSNLTPDKKTGIGSWSTADIVKALRTGTKPNGEVLFLFPPHSFFNNLSDDDANALAAYLKSLKPVRNQLPERDVPFKPPPMTSNPPKHSPAGRTKARAQYLLSALVGCTECHSHTENGKVQKFTGGDPKDPSTGVFRLGPDLPLRATEKGFAAFPYPGYAVVYAPNITVYGKNGPKAKVTTSQLVRTIKRGIGPGTDGNGRPYELGHIMQWQFYKGMSDDDAYAIADLIKSLPYTKHDTPESPIRYGTDWRAAFKQVFGEAPSKHDEEIYGK